uniref:Uncharacterized protein n=1 Tax=Arundo donax TaxID=35708 RepID=A0A0A9A9W8_ARUDO
MWQVGKGGNKCENTVKPSYIYIYIYIQSATLNLNIGPRTM